MQFFFSSEQHFSASYYFNKIYKPIMQLLEDELAKRDYGAEFDRISIITIIVPKQMIDDGFSSERKYINRKQKFADIRLQIDLERFLKENEEVQRLLYIKNIIESIRIVASKSKGDFNSHQLETDILDILKVKKEELESL